MKRISKLFLAAALLCSVSFSALADIIIQDGDGNYWSCSVTIKNQGQPDESTEWHCERLDHAPPIEP